MKMDFSNKDGHLFFSRFSNTPGFPNADMDFAVGHREMLSSGPVVIAE